MSKKEEKKDLVPVKKNTLPVPVKKGQLKTPFSLVDEAIYLNNRKDVQSILPDVLGRVLARIWIDAEFRDAFKTEPQKMPCVSVSAVSAAKVSRTLTRSRFMHTQTMAI